jgi:hypothetical protein
MAALVVPSTSQTVGDPPCPREQIPISPDVNGNRSLDFKGKAIMLSFWSCYTDTCFTSVRVFEELLKVCRPRL